MVNKMRTGDGKFRPLPPAPEASTRTRTRPCLDIRRADPPVGEVDGPPAVVGTRSAIRDLLPLHLRHRPHLQ